MKNWILLIAVAVLLVFLSAGLVDAIDVPVECRVRNVGGRCAWACLQTAANVHGERRLFGLINRRGALRSDAYSTDDFGEINKIERCLHDAGVPCHVDADYTYDYETLWRFARRNGVMVSLYKGSTWLHGRKLSSAHAVLVTDIDDEWVYFYCPDNPQQIWRGSRDWFKAAWAGNAVVILLEDSASGE